MAKYLIILILLIAPSLVFASFDHNLYYGIRGSSEVQELQEFLIDQGLANFQPTGNFFSLTLKAVKAFQVRESITPVSGYFGIKSRTRANAILAEALGSLIDEEGAPITPSTSTPATNDDLLKSLQTQNQLLQAQNQALQQIQQNTTPVPVPSVVVPEVKKELKIIDNYNPNLNSGFKISHDISVYYSENYKDVNTDSITISSDDNGEFFGSSNYGYRPCSGGETANSDGTQRKGNPITCSTRTYGLDALGRPDAVAQFKYTPRLPGTRTITATANGVTATITVSGQTGICSEANADYYIGCNPSVSSATRIIIDPTFSGKNFNSVLPKNYTHQSIGTFTLTQSDEAIAVQKIEGTIEGNSNNALISGFFWRNVWLSGQFAFNSNNKWMSTFVENVSIKPGTEPSYTITIDTPPLPGNYTLTITGIEVIGQSSGQTRTGQGLPITFTFTVQ